jgi:hypothetical protein
LSIPFCSRESAENPLLIGGIIEIWCFPTAKGKQGTILREIVGEIREGKCNTKR